MGLNAYTQTEDRIRVIDYSQTFIFVGYNILIKRPPATDGYFMIYPFTLFTWVTLVAAMIGQYLNIILY